MSFENLSQQEMGGKIERTPSNETEEAKFLLDLFKSKIEEKNIIPEIKAFFRENDERNLAMLETHPSTDMKSVLSQSRSAMHQVKKYNDIITRSPKFYRPKIG